MKIDNLKQLEAVVKLCRKLGVEAMEIDTIKFNLGPAPKANRRNKTELDIPEANMKIPQYTPISTVQETVADVIKTDGLSDEDLLFYSASGQSVEEQKGQ